MQTYYIVWPQYTYSVDLNISICDASLHATEKYRHRLDTNVHTVKFPPSKEIVRFRQMLPNLTSRWSRCPRQKAEAKTATIYEGGHAEEVELNPGGALIFILVLHGEHKRLTSVCCQPLHGEIEQP